MQVKTPLGGREPPIRVSSCSGNAFYTYIPPVMSAKLIDAQLLMLAHLKQISESSQKVSKEINSKH